MAPNFERLRELSAILGSSELAAKLGNRIVEGLEAKGGNAYRVWTAGCSVEVTLTDASSGPPIAGGWQFAINVGELHCP